MLELNFSEQESALNQSLDKMISGTLPHKNFDSKYVGVILESILDYIKLSELRMEYYVFVSVLMDYMELRAVAKDFVPMLQREDLQNYLQAELYDLVTVPAIGMQEHLRFNALPTDLTDELNREAAANRLYELVMEKYDHLFEMGLGGEEALSQLPILRSAVIQSVGYNSLRIQREILDNGKWISKVYYRGSEGWLKYMGAMYRDVSMRVEGKGSSVYTMDSTGKIADMRQKFRELYQSFAKTGWDPYDTHLGFVRNRLSIIVGDESIGKTAIAVSLTAMAIMQGASVLYMYTEGTESETYARILTAYIFFKYQKFITTDHLAGKLPMDEKMDKLVDLCMLEISEMGNLHLVESSTYADLYTDLMNYHDRYMFDIGIIDHTAALKGKTEQNKDISMLSTHLLEFKKDRGVHMFATSHASYQAKELAAKGKQIRTSAARGSATISEAADDVFYLTSNSDMEKQGLISCFTLKSRKGPKNSSFVLSMYSEVSSVRFEAAKQGLLGGGVATATEVLKDIKKTYSDDYDDDDEDLGDDVYAELDTEIFGG